MYFFLEGVAWGGGDIMGEDMSKAGGDILCGKFRGGLAEKKAAEPTPLRGGLAEKPDILGGLAENPNLEGLDGPILGLRRRA